MALVGKAVPGRMTGMDAKFNFMWSNPGSLYASA
jgi:hypothetical protein